jgi:hypothetical protein
MVDFYDRRDGSIHRTSINGVEHTFSQQPNGDWEITHPGSASSYIFSGTSLEDAVEGAKNYDLDRPITVTPKSQKDTPSSDWVEDFDRNVTEKFKEKGWKPPYKM